MAGSTLGFLTVNDIYKGDKDSNVNHFSITKAYPGHGPLEPKHVAVVINDAGNQMLTTYDPLTKPQGSVRVTFDVVQPTSLSVFAIQVASERRAETSQQRNSRGY